MITISNLRKESNKDVTKVVCDISSDYSEVDTLWFSVPVEYGDWLTDDVYDALMLAMLYPAMFYNEGTIRVKGNVSEKLHYNLSHYVQSVITAYRPEMKPVSINVDGYQNTISIQQGVGTAFSAGIDAFTTLYDHYEMETNPNYKISSLFFFNLGSHGAGELAREKFHSRYDYLKDCADQLSLPFIPMDSNLFDFYIQDWEFDAGIFCRAAGALIFQKALKKYYIAGDNAYIDQMDYLFDKTRVDLSSISENYLFPLLSTETLDLIPDGAQYTRSQKVERIINYPPVREYLNVCVDKSTSSAANCSICHKCQRTMFALDVLGKMSEFSNLFDINKWNNLRFRYKCQLIVDQKKDVYAHDNVELARRYNYKMPSKLMSCVVIKYNEWLLEIKRAILKMLGRL